MKNAFKAGIEFYKKEGIRKFIIRIFNWIPEYMRWLKSWGENKVRTFLMERSDVYRGWKRYEFLENDLKVDSYVRFLKITGGLEYCRSVKQPYKILNNDEKIEVVLSECFEEREKAEKLLFDSPPIYLTVFKDVKVYGSTNLLSKGSIALSDMYERDRGKNRYNIEGGCLIVCQRKGAWIGVASKKSDVVIEEAINCVGWACTNYWHLTFEILSRLVFADKYEEYRTLPVLVDAAILKVPQMKDLLNRLNVYHHPVIPVDEYQCVHVKKLVYISRNMWMPPNFRNRPYDRAEDFMFHRSVADNIRNMVLHGVKQQNEVYKKIYVSRRNCSNQRLVNGDEIERLFSDNGYHIIFPEDLSFDEEVGIFNNADVIVGASGAAFTNIVYCHENAKVAMITNLINAPYCFSNIANMVNVDFQLLRADVVKKEKYASGDTFTLNVDKCKRFIEYIDKQ